ncbi:MAG: helix-turn-helix transcriptional regulator [Gammaproteobacteria bacterium]|nr:helix-turn-helix transcriptional regulator [Gammaproteobacteria bacterium]
MSVTQAFGALVRETRMKLGLSQEELAERCGMHRNAIGFIERGERSPSIESVFAIATGLGISASKLIGRLDQALSKKI